MASAPETVDEPRLKVAALRRSLESLMIISVAAEVPQNKLSKFSLKKGGGGGSQASNHDG